MVCPARSLRTSNPLPGIDPQCEISLLCAFRLTHDGTWGGIILANSYCRSYEEVRSMCFSPFHLNDDFLCLHPASLFFIALNMYKLRSATLLQSLIGWLTSVVRLLDFDAITLLNSLLPSLIVARRIDT